MNTFWFNSTFNKTVRRDRIFTLFSGRLDQLSISHHPAFRFNPWQEGFRNFVFGGRAGPSIDLINLCHELAHAAEFGPDQFKHRAMNGRYRFDVAMIEIDGDRYENPLTSQATLREIRSLGLQLHLLRKIGYKVKNETYAKDSARTLDFMSDAFVPLIPGMEPKDRQRHCAQMILAHYEQTSLTETLESIEAWLDKTHELLDETDGWSQLGGHSLFTTTNPSTHCQRPKPRF